MLDFNLSEFIERDFIELKDGKKECVGDSIHTFEEILRNYCGDEFAEWTMILLNNMYSEIEFAKAELDKAEDKVESEENDYNSLRCEIEETAEELDRVKMEMQEILDKVDKLALNLKVSL